jgi:Flp pilus assembly protein TadG
MKPMLFSPVRPPLRRAAAVAEFALVAPIVFALVMAAIEFGRAYMSLNLISNAARAGCRKGVLPGSSNDDVTSAVNSALSAGGISGATTTVMVNGAVTNASTAAQGDQISVEITVPFSQVTWLPTTWFLGDATLAETSVMRHE